MLEFIRSVEFFDLVRLTGLLIYFYFFFLCPLSIFLSVTTKVLREAWLKANREYHQQPKA